ncbi:MAG: hypothetical protein NXI23_06450 [Bacteroidetes bacterium]|jgi:hypothetical protein|nr:hypothetical protein [Bacteroidota bacterium]MDF1867643.1 hypothetical protein [Saprospiraceae bacterium]
MKSSHSTDRIFQEKLGDYASDAPMHIWDRIDQKRSPKRRAWILFRRNWGMAFLVLLLIGSAGYFMVENQNSNKALSDQEIKESEELNTDKQNFVEEKAVFGQVDIVGNETVLNTKNVKEIDQKNVVNSSKELIDSKANNISKVALETNYSNRNNLQINNTSVENRTLNPNQNNIEKTNYSQENAFENQTAKVQEERIFSPVAIANNFSIQKLQFGISEIDFEGSEMIFSEPNVRDYKNFLKRKGDPEKGCPRIEKGKRYNTYLDILIGPDYAIRNLRSKSPDDVNYLKARETTESYRYAYSGGLRLSFLNRKGLALRTGLMYSQIAEKFEHNIGNAQQINIEPIPQADGTILYDTTVVFGDRFITSFNRLHQLDIPIIVGYEVHYGKWAYGVNAGVNFNILFKQKGDFLAPDLTPQTFTSGDSEAFPAFRKNLGISFYGSISMNYEINENLYFLFEPQFRYYQNSFSRSDYILDQQYFSVGVLTGLRMKF